MIVSLKQRLLKLVAQYEETSPLARALTPTIETAIFLNRRAEEKMQLGLLNEAKAVLTYVVNRWASYKEGSRNLGVVYCRLGDYGAALSNLRHALSLDPSDRMTVKHYSKALMAARRWATAHDLLETYLSGTGESADQELADIFKETRNILHDAESLVRSGEKLFEQGFVQEAEKVFLELLKICSDYADAYNDLGLLYRQKGDRERSLDFFSRGCAISPRNKCLLMNYSGILSELCRWDEIKRVCSCYLENHSEDTEVADMLAHAENRIQKEQEDTGAILGTIRNILVLGDPQTALTVLAKSLEAYPASHALQILRGMFESSGGNKENAKQIFLGLLRCHPSCLMTKVSLSILLFETGDSIGGQKYLEEAFICGVSDDKYILKTYLDIVPLLAGSDIAGIVAANLEKHWGLKS